MTIRAFAAIEPGGRFEPFEYDPGDLAHDEVEIDVAYCGICQSDLSMRDNDWKITTYPFVGGHEVSGTVAAKGAGVQHLEVGQRVGVGWFSNACSTCDQCLSGDHNLCLGGECTIIGRHGGFADKIRASAIWTTPIPDSIDLATAGPFFCAGITVFHPLVRNGVSPTDRVAVIGVGGLGHIALQFLHKWGCEVTAISTSPAKEQEAKALGAHHFINAREPGELKRARRTFDLVLDTSGKELPWDAYIKTLRPRGRLHLVGIAPSVSASVFPLISGEHSIGASPLGSPATTRKMLDFAARHGIATNTEVFPMSEINEAFAKLESDRPPHRIVLRNDFR